MSNMETNSEKKSITLVEVMDDGPLKIIGNFILKDLKRDLTESPSEVYLCRCGRSEKKPYCDCSHER
jgi:CDGSH iron-sulfur domain-containing protein 3